MIGTAVFLVFDAVAAVAVVTQASNQDDSITIEMTADAKQMMRSDAPPRGHDIVHGAKIHAASSGPGSDRSAKDLASAAPSPHSGGAPSPPANATKKVKIELYYETRCPDCIEFINMSLAPLWRNADLRKHYDIKMNPFGNAQSVPVSEISEGYKFWNPESTGSGFEMVEICQHGTDECFGNLIQACAITDEPAEKHMELAFCMASVPNWGIEKSSYECMQKLKIDTQKNRNCVKSARGNKILTDMGKETKKVPGRLGTPWVMINGQNLKNPGDLLRSICDNVGPNAISDCKPFQKKSKASHDSPHKEKEGDDDDTFQVFPKLNNVDRSLVMLPPPAAV
jgi:interferon gamma-inducible protein 30